MHAEISKLESLIGYKFCERELLVEALSHPSINVHTHGKLKPTYQRLEFLGDAVLGLIISEILYNKFPHSPEGKLAKMRASLVCKEELYKVAASFELQSFILMSDGEEKTGGRENINNIEDVLEALIGAIYLDGGLINARSFIDKIWAIDIRDIEEDVQDPKSALQELAQEMGKPLPIYHVVSQSGTAHDPEFVIEVQIAGTSPTTGIGNSKKSAEKEAAGLMLKKLSE